MAHAHGMASFVLSPSESIIYAGAYCLRLFLIFYGGLFAPQGTKYEDIDYEVFTNASRAIYEGGNAFECDTYRYTPLLAWVLQPNIFLNRNFGKLLFITIDVFGAYLLHYIMQTYLTRIHFQRKIHCMLWISILWLFNPMIFTISSRGSCDSLVIFFVLCTFYFILNKQYYCAGILYGLCVHFRIYPFIYALCFVLFISHANIIEQKKNNKAIDHIYISRWTVIRRMFVNINVWSFGLMSLFSFICLNLICYIFMGGDVFLKESYLYHFSRIDDQHNFSIYFYFFRASKLNSYDALNLYENCILNRYNDLIGYCVSPLISRFSFVPQFLYIIMVSVTSYRNLHFALFLNTLVFVTFNKVCTSQYFIWYICLLPLVLPFTAPNQDIGSAQLFCGFTMDSVKRWWYYLVMCTALWFAANGHWLYWAYRYEILREGDTLIFVWIASIVFFMVNNVLILMMLNSYDSYPLLLNYVVYDKKKKSKKKQK